MPSVKPVRAREQDDRDAVEFDDPEAMEALENELYEIFRVICPDCAQPIALLADEETLPEHALCATPWNPFGPAVCQGSGRPADEADPADDMTGTQEHDVAALLTLPEGLDWRTQPFSHAGGPGAHSVRKPRTVVGRRG